MTVQRLGRHLMKLDVHSRSKLVSRLLSSLDELSDAENEQLWAEEAFRRHEELVKSKVRSRPARAVFRNARSRLK